jgi:hypothetical protein
MPRHLRRLIVASGCLGLLSVLPACSATAVPLIQDDPAGDSSQIQQSDTERITVGRFAAHDFQNQTPDDPGAELHRDEISLPQLLATLGPDATLWYQHVLTLSNPFFEGRRPGLAGNRHAADYLEFWFREYGLEPAFPAETVAAMEEGESAGDDSSTNGAPHDANEARATSGEWVSYRQPFLPRDNAEMRTDNVGGILRGRGDLAEQWIIIGGHYDHTGYGRQREGEERGPLNPGADDNASGTSAVLVLAKRLTEAYANAPEDRPLRSILFMGFSAEEMGLLGSEYYVRNSTLPADKISIMLNLDMVGRLRGDNLLVGGVESAEGLLNLIRPRLLETGLNIFADPSGQGPSDHAEFFGAGIPVLFFFTGTHSVYHRPGDVGPSVDPRGAVKIIDLVHNIAWDRATEPQMLKFSNVAQGPPRRPRATLGVVPGPVAGDGAAGVRISILSADSPAAKAGLLVEDIILAWNGEPVENISALQQRIRAGSPGDEVTLTIRRGDEQFDVKVTLGERQ